ncbi:hypothetical protein V6N12_069749 [Hibiscus sabdariffa]|uniref:Uncharacterized protein n=1 Tax=Hibiscus sabdariffa TaxID=183260 RepID=A0ABR2FER2_9ROSI
MSPQRGVARLTNSSQSSLPSQGQTCLCNGANSSGEHEHLHDLVGRMSHKIEACEGQEVENKASSGNYGKVSSDDRGCAIDILEGVSISGVVPDGQIVGLHSDAPMRLAGVSKDTTNGQRGVAAGFESHGFGD